MPEHIPLRAGDIALQAFFVSVQQALSGADYGLPLEISGASTLHLGAGPGNEQVSLSIEGKLRWRTSDLDVSDPGGPVGTHHVWATASANALTGPTPETLDQTDYNFGLVITAADVAPAGSGIAHTRKVATLQWSGQAITSLTMLVGNITAAQKAALVGSVGAPSETNRYVTQADPILGSGAPTGAAGGELAGNYPNPTIGAFSTGRVLSWGGDTILLRDMAATLRTGGTFKANGGIYAAVGLAEQVYIGAGAGVPTVYLGPALDAGLQRIAAGHVRVNSRLSVGSAEVMPPGIIHPYAGLAQPAGWLWCDGASVSRTTYAALFAAIGTAFGSADANSFSLPDLRDRVPVGSSATIGRGAAGGAKTHALTADEMPSHQHNLGTNNDGVAHSIAAYGGGNPTPEGMSVASGAGYNGGFLYAMHNGGGGAHNNMQPYLGVNYIIKT